MYTYIYIYMYLFTYIHYGLLHEKTHILHIYGTILHHTLQCLHVNMYLLLQTLGETLKQHGAGMVTILTLQIRKKHCNTRCDTLQHTPKQQRQSYHHHDNTSTGSDRYSDLHYQKFIKRACQKRSTSLQNNPYNSN